LKTLWQCDQIVEIDCNHSSNHNNINEWFSSRKEISPLWRAAGKRLAYPLKGESKQIYQQLSTPEGMGDSPFEYHSWSKCIVEAVAPAL
jgi:hypothetical protein